MKTKLFKGIMMCMSVFAITSCGGGGSPTSGTPSSTTEEKPTSATTTSTTSQTPGDDFIRDEKSLKYALNDLYPGKEMYDEKNGLGTFEKFEKMRAFSNGKYVGEFTTSSTRQDVKLELYGKSAVRFANVSNGYVFTLPFNEIEVDYEIAKYRTVINFGDSTLSVSFESSNPYTSLSTPWYTYASEWLMRHILNNDYISNNGLERTIPMTYKFSKSNPYGDTTTKPGYDIYVFGVKIAKDKENQIDKPYYNIAVIREKEDPKNFVLLVMKSKTEQSELMNKIVESYARINSKGTPRNYFYSEAAKAVPTWDEATKGLFDKLTTTEYVNWGVFTYSMPGSESGLHPGQSEYDQTLAWSKDVQGRIETAWNHKYEIFATYNHLTFGNSKHYFPLDMANELAGGDGKNGKPFLQFTLQYTTNNNSVSSESTPIFDIMRGKYDEDFHKLAKDMKSYGKPILLRLNNEMNTDWTSYCGMMSLLDPDIFVMTWRRFYDICMEEGCTNLIWIWNPIAKSCPYSSWGEDLPYFPGFDYVQLLGATSYEFNNYDAKEAASKIQSFKKLYTDLFDKNCKNFSTNWKVIISEFACGSGGATTGVLGRNAKVQAQWVKEMFEEMNSPIQADYIKQIRGAVWFNANDYEGSVISNRLQLVNRPNQPRENYDDLADTMAAFRKGFEDQDKRLGK